MDQPGPTSSSFGRNTGVYPPHDRLESDQASLDTRQVACKHEVMPHRADFADRDSIEWIDVTLSGGGYRASLFSLGALLYLEDCGLSTRIRSLASVSGGSITSGFLASRGAFRSGEFWPHAKGLIDVTVRGTTPRPSIDFGPIAFSTVALVAGILAVALAFTTSATHWIPAAALIALSLVVFESRGYIVELWLRQRFVGNITLDDLVADPVVYGFCSTNLNSSAPCFFSNLIEARVDLEPLGRGHAHIDLATVIRASAAFPVVVKPVKLDVTAQYGPQPVEEGSTGARPKARGAVLKREFAASLLEGTLRVSEFGTDLTTEVERSVPSPIYLADGGLWNNLGNQWSEFVSAEWESVMKDTGAETALAMASAPRFRLLVDATAPNRTRSLPRWLMRVPFLAELAVVVLSLSSSYRGALTYPQREPPEAVDEPEPTAAIQSWRVSIEQGPGDEAREFQNDGRVRLRLPFGTERARRASSYRDETATWTIGSLGLTSRKLLSRAEEESRSSVLNNDLRALSEFTANIPTRLSRRTHDEAQALVVHGYLMTREVLWIHGDIEPPGLPKCDACLE